MSKMRARYTTRRAFLRESCMAVMGVSYLGVGFKADAAPGDDLHPRPTICWSSGRRLFFFPIFQCSVRMIL